MLYAVLTVGGAVSNSMPILVLTYSTELVPLFSGADGCHNTSEQRGGDVVHFILAVYLQHCDSAMLHDPVPGNH